LVLPATRFFELEDITTILPSAESAASNVSPSPAPLAPALASTTAGEAEGDGLPDDDGLGDGLDDIVEDGEGDPFSDALADGDALNGPLNVLGAKTGTLSLPHPAISNPIPRAAPNIDSPILERRRATSRAVGSPSHLPARQVFNSMFLRAEYEARFQASTNVVLPCPAKADFRMTARATRYPGRRTTL
jgi:hypothetical protein